MANKNQKAAQEGQVVNTVSNLEVFFKKHKNVIEWSIIGVIAVVCAFLAINRWYLIPAKEEAKSQMFVAEQLFAAGDYTTALNGDGNNLGFNDVIAQYGSKAGKIVYLYAGICNLRLGNNEEALSLLKKYSTSDKILSARALCCMGDAYANLGDNASAVAHYKKAVAKADNAFAAGYLLKEGVTYEAMGEDQKALECYKKIELDYPQSLEGYDIQKYINRIENK